MSTPTALTTTVMVNVTALPAFTPAYLLESSATSISTFTSMAASALPTDTALPAASVLSVSGLLFPTAGGSDGIGLGSHSDSFSSFSIPTTAWASTVTYTLSGYTTITEQSVWGVSPGDQGFTMVGTVTATDTSYEWTSIGCGYNSYYTPTPAETTELFRVTNCLAALGANTSPVSADLVPGSAPFGELPTADWHVSILPYAIAVLVWSIFVAVGMAAVWWKRQMRAVKLRDWRWIFAAVAAIEIYLLFTLIETWVHVLPCQATFWVTAIFFAFCFAAVEAANARLVGLYVANVNNALVKASRKWTPARRDRKLFRLWHRLSFSDKLHVAIAFGFIVEIILALVLFFGGSRFHIAYGLWGDRERFSPHADAHACNVGFEWVVIVMWPHLWSLILSAVLLWQIRHVRDVYHWSSEAKMAIVAAIPGPVLYMSFIIYALSNTWSNIWGATVAGTVNGVFPSIWWLIPGLAAIQAILLAFPFFNACTTDLRLKKERLSHIGLFDNVVGVASIDMMMKVIDGPHAHRLIEYAASTRFNAELIIFLRDIKIWRVEWTASGGPTWVTPTIREHRILCYKHAALIYFRLIDVDTAPFPVPIHQRKRESLREDFRHARLIQNGREIQAAKQQQLRTTETAWSPDASPTFSQHTTSTTTKRDIATPAPDMRALNATLEEAKAVISITSPSVECLEPSTLEGIHMAELMDAPDTFTLIVFDDAYKEIKRDAYHNIWLPYVKSGKYDQEFRHEAEYAA